MSDSDPRLSSKQARVPIAHWVELRRAVERLLDDGVLGYEIAAAFHEAVKAWSARLERAHEPHERSE